MKPREYRVTRIVIAPQGEPLYSEMATTVEITDEAAGEFVEIRQHGAPEIGTVQISPKDWPLIRRAVDRLIKDCRGSA